MSFIPKIDLSLLREESKPTGLKYQCPVCNFLLREAIQTVICGHWMCECCAAQIYQTPCPICPLGSCQERLADTNDQTNTLYFPDRSVRSEIRDLSLLCPIDGCTWCGRVAEYTDHLSRCANVCPYCEEILPNSNAYHLCVCAPPQATDTTNTDGHLRFTARSVKSNDPQLIMNSGDIPQSFEYLEQISPHKLQYNQSPVFELVSETVGSVTAAEDGFNVWEMKLFSKMQEDVRMGKYSHVLSPSFYTSNQGYKMCLRLYLNGDGIGIGTHMSLFFVVMKGEFDNILQWPFTHKVTFKLINQCGGRDIVDIFQPDPMSTSFQKPKTDMNVASGCPRFVSSNELMQGGFIVDDTIFIKVKVDSKLSSPKEVEEYNSVQCSDHSTDYSLVPVQPASLKQATCTDFVAGNYSLLLKKLKDSFIYVNHQEMNMTLSKSSCSECTMKHSKIDKTKNIIYETLKTSNGDHPWFHVASKPSGFRWNVNIDELLENGQVESPFFYSKFAEYKMVAGLRVFEKDKVTLVEVYFAIVQGEFDDCIEWPFSHTVVVKIVGQDGYQSVVQSDIQLNSRAFEKPLSDRNISCCCPNFLSFDELMGFAIKETVFFEIEVK